MQNRKKVQKQSNARKAGRSTRKRNSRRNNKASRLGIYTNEAFERAGLGVRGFASDAPIAVSDDLQQFVRFERGSKDSNLMITCCIPLYQICSNRFTTSLVTGGLSQDGTSNFASVSLGATGGTDSSSTADVDRTYLSPVLLLQGTSFVRYAIRKMKFIYEPQSPTTTTDRMIFAFANDPNHPNINPTGDVPTQSNLLALSDSVAFAPWRSWSLDVSKSVNQNLLYTFEEDNSPAENRFTFFGAIGCVPSVQPTVATPTTIYGILYGCFTIEFREFCPLIEGFTPTTRSLLRKRGFRKTCSDPECKSCQRKCLNKITSTDKVEKAKALDCK